MNLYLERTIDKLKILQDQFNDSKNPVYRFGILVSILNELKETHDELLNNQILYKGTENEMLKHIDEKFQEKERKKLSY